MKKKFTNVKQLNNCISQLIFEQVVGLVNMLNTEQVIKYKNSSGKRSDDEVRVQ